MASFSSEPPVSGHVFRMPRKSGERWMAKWRDTGGQHQKVLGRAFTGRGRPPEGYLTKLGAQRELDAILATARAGRFLAGDDGIRYELKRRFRSGVEVGAWYTLTDGHDITGPGSPGAPYRDKGVFVAIPLSSMLTADTRQSARIALSPWSRDVGQMVTPPDDLYQSLEQAAVRGVRDGLAAPEFLR